jgi:hypothetical protein
MAEVDVRRSLFPDQLIRFDEPPGDGQPTGPSASWTYVAAAALARTGPAAVLMRRRYPDMRAAAVDARAAAHTAADVGAISARRALHGLAADHSKAMLSAATSTLERLADLGWRAVVGDAPRSAGRGRDAGAPSAIGGDAVAERTESFDALAAFDPDR